MNVIKLFKRPVNNQEGFAVIIMISLISVLLTSYSLYASNYFLLLTHEVKQAKRVINGINVLQQVAQTLYRAREVHHGYKSNALANCAAEDADYPTEIHDLCVPDLTIKADGLCVSNPFVDPAVLCVRAAGSGGPGRNIIEITAYDEPAWYEPYVRPLLKPINDFTYSYGKAMVALAEGLSNRAVAYPESDALPPLTGAPTLTKSPNLNKTCGSGDLPSEECMRCKDNGGPAAVNSRRPECFTLKVCLRPDLNADGFADCDPAINEQWVWQMVAIIHPVGP